MQTKIIPLSTVFGNKGGHLYTSITVPHTSQLEERWALSFWKELCELLLGFQYLCCSGQKILSLGRKKDLRICFICQESSVILQLLQAVAAVYRSVTRITPDSHMHKRSIYTDVFHMYGNENINNGTFCGCSHYVLFSTATEKKHLLYLHLISLCKKNKLSSVHGFLFKGGSYRFVVYCYKEAILEVKCDWKDLIFLMGLWKCFWLAVMFVVFYLMNSSHTSLNTFVCGKASLPPASSQKNF